MWNDDYGEKEDFYGIVSLRTEVADNEFVFRKYLTRRTIATARFYCFCNRWFSPCTEEFVRARIRQLVVPECRAGPAILFADLRVPYCIIHCFHVGFHDEILHRGITYTYASRYLRCGTYKSLVPVIFQKKGCGTLPYTIAGNFFEKFLKLKKFFLRFFFNYKIFLKNSQNSKIFFTKFIFVHNFFWKIFEFLKIFLISSGFNKKILVKFYMNLLFSLFPGNIRKTHLMHGLTEEKREFWKWQLQRERLW